MSVQQKLEETLAMVLRQPIAITGAGRTDTGVHASEMVAHFELQEPLPNLEHFVDRLNGVLPKDIAIQKIVPVIADAHARFTATFRKYKYYISTCKDPFHNELHCRVRGVIDMNKMNEATQILFNYIDFTSFSRLHTDAKTNNCQIMHAEWTRINEHEMVFTIQADRFLRNMVRAIVGTLLQVGRGKLSIEEFRQIIEHKDRCKAGDSAVAHALFLVEIGYPSEIFI